MKLDKALMEQVKQILASLNHDYTIHIDCDTASSNGKEMLEFFTDFSTTSARIGIDVQATNSDKCVASIFRDGTPTGISFRGIPGGHEFTSLLLAVLNADGQGRTLPDDATASRISRIQGELSVTVYVSLDCTNCPDVVQAFNQMALFNDRIAVETVNGQWYQPELEALGVKSVPTVYVNGEEFWVGKSSMGELLDKLEERFGSSQTGESAAPERFDLLVLGAGPAASSAAIYSARKGLDVAVVAQRVGGQVNETQGIENLISVPRTTGARLAQDIRTHMEESGAKIFDSRTITEADLKSDIKRVVTKGGEVFEAPRVIIATGARWRSLGVEGENQYIGHGVAFCVHCDGPFFKGKNVAVIGGGNSGVEAAIDLANICNHVDLFEFLDSLKADNVLQDKLHSLPNVSVHLSSAVTKIEGDGKTVTGIEVKDRITDETGRYDLNGIFVQIGLLPNSDLFATQVATERGEIIIDAFCRTDVPGVYAAGDVTNVPYKQIIVAMGEGAKAALAAFDDKLRE